MNQFSTWQLISWAYSFTWLIVAFGIVLILAKKGANRINNYIIEISRFTYAYMCLVIPITVFSLMFQLPYPFDALVPMAVIVICLLKHRTLDWLLS